LGFVNDRDILTVIAAIEATLESIKLHETSPGAGIAAATKILA